MPYVPKQYESARQFLKSYNNLGNIVDPLDNMRLMAYNLYDDFYFNRPETFRVTTRGSTDTEIYLPSTKKIIDSTARFLAVEFWYALTGGESGTDAALANLFEREEISKRFVRGKRSLLTRGDQTWYITADNSKGKGDKITLNTIHPSCVFRIEDPRNPNRVIGYHIVDIVTDPREGNRDTNKQIARRQTYRKEGQRISSQCDGFELGCWDDRYLEPDKIKQVWSYLKKQYLPEQITQLPVYHVPNNEPDGSSWGLSQVAGVEYIINALNQSMTVEDLSLVLSGLGVYVTTAAPPMDKATGRPGKYKLHAGNVVQMTQGDTFERVTGITTVQPFTEHAETLDSWLTSGTGVPDMASGKVDVAVAQSGIALALKMGPIIAENEDKQLAIAGKWNQLGHDLVNMWLPAFEGTSASGEFKATFGDPMPRNRETYVAETTELYAADLITLEEVRERLEKIGYKNTEGVVQKLWDQSEKKAQIASGDAFLAEQGEYSGGLIEELENEDGST